MLLQQTCVPPRYIPGALAQLRRAVRVDDTIVIYLYKFRYLYNYVGAICTRSSVPLCNLETDLDDFSVHVLVT